MIVNSITIKRGHIGKIKEYTHYIQVDNLVL